MADTNPIKDLHDLVESVERAKPRYPVYFFTQGTGISDDSILECFKDIGDVRVVTRRDEVYQRGEFIGYIYEHNK